ncbi:hypothetical protein FB565_003902 [Actinoplanes lutulentus]|uniref:Uncharacterized protein n=1 Tax=Actinoplanes lutulentus TaxID=1287878 RepID=A0A327ZN49_9ACTN|nr:hypothetical protein [Actinoplanes lutulentus]MBB2944173.1 hypothetical protein [Actinoplanes lutulentus]RAK42594.1 hypothetical protein B0I29_102419 [Actinoplanes lutulentus]
MRTAEEDQAPPRPDWRDRFTLGTDIALIGIVTTVFALPVLTAPAALAAGSAAVHHRYRQNTLPPIRPLLRQFREGLLRGLPVLLIALFLLLDLTAVARRWVPGGPVLLIATAAATAWLAGIAGLSLTALGRDPNQSWRTAARWSWTHPAATGAITTTAAIALFLALSVPATIPLIIGFQLFAAHMISDRLT